MVLENSRSFETYFKKIVIKPWVKPGLLYFGLFIFFFILIHYFFFKMKVFMNAFFTYFFEYNRYLNLLGIPVILAIAWLFSAHKKAINYRLIVSALALQAFFTFFMLKTSVGIGLVSGISGGIQYLYDYAAQGTAFIFGSLADATGPWGVIFAIKVLPVIIFFGAFMALLFHFGIIQKVVALLGKLMSPLLGTTGSETLCALSNAFLGQTEAPLLVKNYLEHMTKSEFLVVMVSGMGTISGAILAVYASMGVAIEHLLASSIIAVPGTILIAKILIPETEKTKDFVESSSHESKGNLFEAISVGTSDGLNLMLNVAAMLIAFIALIAMCNGILSGSCSYLNQWFGWNLPLIDLDSIFSVIFYPLSLLMGFTGSDALNVAKLLGTKVAVNEFLAYHKMLAMHLPERVQMLTTYALCGFSNFSSIGIQVGGIGALVPSKKKWLTELGLTAVLGGVLSNLLTALLIGLFV